MKEAIAYYDKCISLCQEFPEVCTLAFVFVRAQPFSRTRSVSPSFVVLMELQPV